MWLFKNFTLVLWRYLLSSFSKMTLTCVLAFIAILLTMRLDEIAHFIALGAPVVYILFFTLYQIPYILPIAIPLSCLIASLLLIQKLSSTHELTALRGSGFSLFDILTPLLLFAAFLSLGNFWIISEVATRSHFQTNLLKSELRSINPLLLLNNKHLMRLKGFYFDALGASRVGESASDVVLVIPNKQQQRLSLMIAQHLKTSPSTLTGEGVTLLVGFPNHEENDFDHLLVENMGQSITYVQDFSNLLQAKVWTINNDYLQMSLLLARIHEQKKLLQEGFDRGESFSTLKILREQLNSSLSEITKRLSIAIAVFSFTLMGATFGIQIGRKRHYYAFFLVIFLTILYLMAFFIAKAMDHYFWLSASLYLVPHTIIILSSIIVLKRVAKGIE